MQGDHEKAIRVLQEDGFKAMTNLSLALVGLYKEAKQLGDRRGMSQYCRAQIAVVEDFGLSNAYLLARGGWAYVEVAEKAAADGDLDAALAALKRALQLLQMVAEERSPGIFPVTRAESYSARENAAMLAKLLERLNKPVYDAFRACPDFQRLLDMTAVQAGR